MKDSSHATTVATPKGHEVLRNAVIMATLAVAFAGCDRSVMLFEPDKVIVTEVLTGTVDPPVEGVAQGVTRTFVVGQGGGEVTVTLTSAVETLPNGSTQANVTMGLGVGTLVDSLCVVPASAFLQTQPGTSPHLAGTLEEGTYCVRVSDVTTQTGPVAFSVTVTHT